VNFRDKVNIHGVKYGNLYDFLNSKAKEGELGRDDDSTHITESEFRDALTCLENDNKISLVGHRLTPTIRFCQD
jgi:hypothetical protein